jgi:diguanylate cyclase (GGDEF)-like protein
MSFRTRLTTFFVVIVVLPMFAVGALVFRLIGDSQQGKADARSAGLATAAASLYLSQSGQARTNAETIARDLANVPTGQIPARVRALQDATGLVRIEVRRGSRILAASGSASAIAPGSASLRPPAGPPLSVTVSTLSAGDLVRELTAAPGAAVLVAQGRRILAASLSRRALPVSLPGQGGVTIAGTGYDEFTQGLPGFGARRVRLTTLSATSAGSGSVATSRAVAIVAIGGFLLLAFAFAVLSARALEHQLRRFLDAARRLAGGDFSAPVPVEGDDEFAALGQEFNRMSSQLEQRLEELSQERARLRESLVRIGQTFASNLDRRRLLELALRTGLDAVDATAGRITVRALPEEGLSEVVREGPVADHAQALVEAERAVLAASPAPSGAPAVGESEGAGGAIALTLGWLGPSGRVRGVMTLVRPAGRFADEDRALLSSLAAQTTLALENVELHYQVRRQAVTDELTGLANHGRFQDMLSAAIEQARRYRHPVALIMVDVDNFKSVNDTFGHQQGDLVLRQIADVLRENSRDADTPARYGGEEMALVLPHTDLDGSYAIAERVRSAIEALRVGRLDGQGVLRVTASLGVAATEGELDQAELIADADAALYRAKHSGKNRTEQAPVRASASGPEGPQASPAPSKV